MADPLSIASSIAGMVAFADLVCVRLIKFSMKYKKVNEEIQQLDAEVRALSAVLHKVELLAQALEDENFNHSLRIYQVEQCHIVLAKIDSLVQKTEKDLNSLNRLDVIQRKLKWALSPSTVKELLEEVSRHKQNFTLAASVDSLDAFMQHLSHMTQLKATVDEISDVVKETRKITTRIYLDSERRKILDFFMPVKPQGHYEEALRLRHPRTGMWLLNLPEFQSWLNIPGSKLWLRGIPGAGKTVLAGSIIEAAMGRSSENVAVAFFFCDYRKEETQSPVNIVGALTAQLALQNDDAFTLLQQHYDELHPERTMGRRASVDGLHRIASDICDLFDHVYIIVDGLDECAKYTSETVETLVYGGFGQFASVALSSRDEGDIRDLITDDFSQIEIAAHSHDISEYVSGQIEERLRKKQLHISDPLLKEEIRQTLIDGAKGMFRWVTVQLDHLRDCWSDRACREALKRLPPDLPETYARILKRVPTSQARLVQMVLNFIAYFPRLRDIKLLKPAISVPESGPFESSDMIHEDAISRLCSSLLRRPGDGKMFEFAHFSVVEFLKSEKDMDCHGLEGFRVSESISRRLLAKQSLRYFLLPNFTASIPLRDFDALKHVIWRVPHSRFYRTALTFWLHCARHEWEDEELSGLAIQLFSTKTSHFILMATTSMVEACSDSDFPYDESEVENLCLSKVQDPGFQPIHLAAALSLPHVVRHLLGSNEETLVSSFGTPLRCAVTGLRPFIVDEEFHGEIYDEPLQDPARPVWVAETVQYIIAHSPSFVFPYPGPDDESLLISAIRTSAIIKDFSIILVLLQAGMVITDWDLDFFDQSLEDLHSWANRHPTRATQVFLPFIQGMGKLINEPNALRMCSMAWASVTYLGLPFSKDPTIVSTQISMTKEVLQERAFRASDLETLERCLLDPRAAQIDFHNSNGCNLLHEALGSPGFGNSRDAWPIIQRLLDFGCNPGQVSHNGSTCLHGWSWAPPIEAGSIGTDVLRALIAAGLDTSVLDNKHRSVLHSACSSRHSWPLKVMLETLSDEAIQVMISAKDISGDTPLITAMMLGEIDSTLSLIPHVNLSNLATKDRTRLLTLAARLGSASVLQSLLDKGLQYQDKDDIQLLHSVGAGVELRCIRILKVLVPEGCNQRFQGRLPLEVYVEDCYHTGLG